MAEEIKYRMLQKKGGGTFYPWTQHLVNRGDMVEVMMTAAEIKGGAPKSASNYQPIKPPPVEEPEDLPAAVEAEETPEAVVTQPPVPVEAKEPEKLVPKAPAKKKAPSSRKGYVRSKGRWVRIVKPAGEGESINNDA
jgi:hypothetical protein